MFYKKLIQNEVPLFVDEQKFDNNIYKGYDI